jgi:acyl-CoA synthetase (AMP-forming)/AMP-acid ligase II
MSYADLVEQIRYVISQLDGRGIGRGDRVALALPNGPELATLSLAVMATATAAPLNPEYRRHEFEHYLSDLDPRLLIVQAGERSPVRFAAQTLDIPVVEVAVSPDAAAGTFTLYDNDGTARTPQTESPGMDDIALVLHTSGTTAAPRTVPLSQGNLSASVDNLIASLALTSDDHCLHVLPMFHIGGLIDVLAAPLAAGGSVTCLSGFSTPAFFQALEADRPTWAQTVPAMLRELVANRDKYGAVAADVRLRFMRSVSAPLPTGLMREFETGFGVPVIEIYGMTETAGVITSNPMPDGVRKTGSVGIAAGPEISVVDDVGNAVPAGKRGEVVVRGASVMRGYDGAAARGQSSFFGNWFRTGDQGYLDENGYLFLTGRIKEIINRGGEKVSPYEIEKVLLDHPDIEDAAVFAVPHETLGEEIAAAVVVSDGAAVSADRLARYLRPELVYFKMPRMFRFVDRIPRTAGGKLQRARLAELPEAAVAHDNSPEQDDPAAQAQSDTPVTGILRKMWADLLELDNVAPDADFFDLGGDSLKAETFVNALEQASGEIIYVSALFDAPTVHEFESFLRQEYPDLIARLLGRTVTAKSFRPHRRLDDETISAFKRSIVPASTVRSAPEKKNRRAIFILSAPRSGSTLFRAMLGGHPRLFAPPELYLLSFADLAERRDWFPLSQRYIAEGNLRALSEIMKCDAAAARDYMEKLEAERLSVADYYALMQSTIGDCELVDKTPFYAMHAESLQRAEDCFEEPLYIHLTRHPYGMIRSFVEARLDQLWYPRIAEPANVKKTPWPYDPYQLGELVWLTVNENITAFLDAVPTGRQFSVTYEALVGTPQETIGEICRFLGVDYCADMIEPRKDPARRMTDGLHNESRMIGDMKFHRHSQIDAKAADSWKDAFDDDFLCRTTFALAQSLGYDETVLSSRDRLEFAI